MHDDHDPRPVFAGEWGKASGKERQLHMQAVAAWKARHPELDGQGAKAGRGGPQSQAQSQDGERAAHLSTLQQVIDEPGALSSDRIRAVEARERILSRQAEEQREEQYGPLVALGDALRALPIEQRVDALSELLTIE